MNQKIPETEHPVQGFFYATGADQTRSFLLYQDAKEEGGDRWSLDTK